LEKSKQKYKGDITPDNILFIFYELMIGKLHRHIKNQLEQWLTLLPKILVLEALSRL